MLVGFTHAGVLIPVEIALLLPLLRHGLGVWRLCLGTPGRGRLVAILLLADVFVLDLLLVRALADRAGSLHGPVFTLALREIPGCDFFVGASSLVGSLLPPSEVRNQLRFLHHVFFDDLLVDGLGLGAATRRRHVPADRAWRSRIRDVGVVDHLVAVRRAIVDGAWNQAIGARQRVIRRAILLPNLRRAIDLHTTTGRDGLMPHVPVTVRGDDGVVTLAGRHHRVRERSHGVVDAIALARIITANACQTFTGWRRLTGLDVLDGSEPIALGRATKVVHRNELGELHLFRIGVVRFGHRQKTHAEVVVERRERQAHRGLGHVQTGAVVAVPDGEVIPLIRRNHSAQPVPGWRCLHRRIGTGVGCHTGNGRALRQGPVVHVDRGNTGLEARSAGLRRILEMRIRTARYGGVRHPREIIGWLRCIEIRSKCALAATG